MDIIVEAGSLDEARQVLNHFRKVRDILNRSSKPSNHCKEQIYACHKVCRIMRENEFDRLIEDINNDSGDF
ncbi:helicase-primase primase subunit [Ochrobactrum phage vB_OspM_OC]|nr:helicase-primase primase subunit [Ochrobactrum phage vB_OspM_OC]